MTASLTTPAASKINTRVQIKMLQNILLKTLPSAPIITTNL